MNQWTVWSYQFFPMEERTELPEAKLRGEGGLTDPCAGNLGQLGL